MSGEIEMIKTMEPDTVDYKEQAERLSRKCDELIDENRELTNKLETTTASLNTVVELNKQLKAENDTLKEKYDDMLTLPKGWDAAHAPTYTQLVQAFVDAQNMVIKLTGQLEQFVYKPEEGKKRPTYKELQGLNMKLRSDAYTMEEEISALRQRIEELEDEIAGRGGEDEDDCSED